MKKQFISFKVLLLFLGLALSLQAVAQGIKITGKVTDATDGKTLPGVTVLIKGTTRGTTTDIDGKFSLDASAGNILVFSYIGYAAQEVTLGAQKQIDVILSPVATGLSEVVVIGYGQVKKGDATGVVSTVSSKNFNKGAITSPQQLIVGKMAGVQVTSANGAPGGDAVIRIRGGSSLTASNDPLVVIDGVPVENSSISGVRSPLSTINPNDIETFTVLKDASATAIYGSRASNGVIIITTKKGASGKPKIEYGGSVSIYTIPKTIDVLDGEEYRTLLNERYKGNDNVLSLLGDANTDWQKEIYQTAIAQDHNLSVSGQIKTMPYRVSVGFTNQDGILKTDNMKRTSLAATLNPTFLDNHLKVSLNGRMIFMHNKFADWSAIGSAIQMDPTKPVTTADTAYGGYWAWLQNNDNPVDQATSNPVARLNLRDDQADANRIIGNAQFDYKFHFLPELRANLNLGWDRSTSDGTTYVPKTATWEFTRGGVDNKYDQTKENTLLDFYLNYVKELSSINSKIDIMGGYSWQHIYQENNTYNANVDHTDTSTVIDKGEYYLLSFFGRINYTLADKYLLTFTLRNDQSSRFSKDTRSGMFPSAAIAWKINEENFLKDSRTVSQLKLRVGYGITGQQDIGGYYPYLPRYTFGDQYSNYLFGSTYYATLRPEGYDANIKWEETTTYNFGLDFGFFKDRITGSIEYYERYTKDLLNEIPVPAGTNLSNYIITNIGDMENKGVELNVTGRIITKSDMNWDVTFNITHNKNQITKLTATDDPSYLGVFTGGISGGVGNTVQIHSVGHPINSFYVFEQVYDANGDPIENLYVDRNGDGKITDDDRYHYKSPNANFWFGLSSSFSYKKFDVSFSGHANFGNYVYDNVNSNNATYERLYRPEGPYLANMVSEGLVTEFVMPRYLSDYFIKDASFFKLDNLSFGYNVGNLYKNTAALRLSATINNVFTISKYDGIDPEIFGGIDNNLYPRSRVFVIGANLTF